MMKVKCTLTLILLIGVSAANADVGTWQTGTADTMVGTPNPFPAIAKDSNGNFFGTWKRGGNGPVILSRWNGSSWSTISSFTTANAGVDNLSDSLSLAIDANGHFHIAFKASTGSGTTSRRGIRYAFFNGANWSFADIASYTDPSGWKNTYNPVIALDPAGHPHIVFQFSDANNPRLHSLEYAEFNGGSWSVNRIRQVSGSGARDVSYPSLAIDSFGASHLSFMQNDLGENQDDNLYYGTNQSGSWQFTPLVTGTSVQPGENSSLALDNADNIHIAYHERVGQDLLIINNVGGSWSSPIPIEVNADDCGWGCHLSINASNDKMIAYSYTNAAETIQGMKVATQVGTGTWETELAFSETDMSAWTCSYIAAAMNDANEIMTLCDHIDSNWTTKTVRYATGTLGLCNNVDCSVPPDQCHLPGTCDPSTGQCDYPKAPNGTQCDDGDPTTNDDQCTDGTCGGTQDLCYGVDCSTPPDVCHETGTCDPNNGQCVYPNAPNGTQCDDGDPATFDDHCTDGTCGGTQDLCYNVDCSTPPDVCHEAGTCDPNNGQCVYPDAPDGTQCDDGDPTTGNDQCSSGTCSGTPLAPPEIQSWQSQRVHGSSGLLGFELDPTKPTSEPRKNGIQFILITFSEAIEIIDGTLDGNEILVEDSQGISYGSQVGMSLTNNDTTIVIEFAQNPPDMETYTFAIDSSTIQSSTSTLQLTGDTDCIVRSLVGDADNNGMVDKLDRREIKINNNADPTVSGNARYDLTLDGRINLVDSAFIRGYIGNSAP